MKITKLEMHEFMRIECLELEFAPSGVTAIGAPNGGGKTSIIDFLRAAFGGKAALPAMPVHKGEKKSLDKITLDDEGRCVTIDLEIQEDRELKATVRQDGGRPFNSPAAMLRGWVNTFSFDPFKIMDLRGREQRDVLLECLGVDFTDLEAKAEKIKAERTAVGRDVHGREKQLEDLPEYAGVPSVEQSASELGGKLQEGMKANERRRKYAEALDAWQEEIVDARAEVSALEDKLGAARQRLAEAERKVPAAERNLGAMPEIDLAPLRAAMDQVDTVNKKVRSNILRAALVEQFRKDHERFAELGEELKGIDAKKQERLASAKAPVDGLEFREDGVYFQGLPLSQESGSGQMIRAVELVAALNPKLRCIVIDDGERLMLPRLKELDEWAQAHDYQVCVLRASTGPECQFVLEGGKLKEGSTDAEGT
jgi:flagellar biosynthesis chaperone FliJ